MAIFEPQLSNTRLHNSNAWACSLRTDKPATGSLSCDRSAVHKPIIIIVFYRDFRTSLSSTVYADFRHGLTTGRSSCFFRLVDVLAEFS